MKKKVVIIFLIIIIILVLTGVSIFFLKNKSQNKPSQNKEKHMLYIGQ